MTHHPDGYDPPMRFWARPYIFFFTSAFILFSFTSCYTCPYASLDKCKRKTTHLTKSRARDWEDLEGSSLYIRTIYYFLCYLLACIEAKRAPEKDCNSAHTVCSLFTLVIFIPTHVTELYTYILSIHLQIYNIYVYIKDTTTLFICIFQFEYERKIKDYIFLLQLKFNYIKKYIYILFLFIYISSVHSTLTPLAFRWIK